MHLIHVVVRSVYCFLHRCGLLAGLSHNPGTHLDIRVTDPYSYYIGCIHKEVSLEANQISGVWLLADMPHTAKEPGVKGHRTGPEARWTRSVRRCHTVRA